MKHTVKDGVTTLQFDGVLLAQSSSRFGARPRWVEFKLYRTPKGTYILSRVGVSVYYHSSDCPVVSRNRLSAVDEQSVSPEYVPCGDCRPSRISTEGIFPETPRYWAQASDTPKGVLSALMKYDDNGTEYLTNVARHLLEDAADLDDDIAQVFFVRTIE